MTQITATLIDSMGSDLSVVNAARVSFGKKSEWNPNFRDEKPLYERDAKLIKYLAKHKHLSPFGHAFASFHIKAPIFVARQLVKHKFLRWNEISRRYVDDKPEFYVPDVWRGKAESVKQGSSSEGVDLTTISASLGDATDTLATTLEWHKEDCLRIYRDLIESGVAPEMARMVLPQSTMTEFYWSGSLDAFAKMCRLRCAPDTQYESRLVADDISAQMSKLFPVSWEALTKPPGDTNE
jgi:thymidylate synthase (FAD)